MRKGGLKQNRNTCCGLPRAVIRKHSYWAYVNAALASFCYFCLLRIFFIALIEVGVICGTMTGLG